MKKWTATMLVALMCISLCACSKPVETYTETRLASYNGSVSTSGDSFIPAQDGTTQKITGETKTSVASDVESIKKLTNDAMIFAAKETIDAPINENEVPTVTEAPAAAPPEGEKAAETEKVEITIYSRYVFETGEIYSMGEILDYYLADIGAALLYTTRNKDTPKYELHLVKGDEIASNVVASTSNQLSAAGINHDGSAYVWAESSEEEYSVYVHFNGEKEKPSLEPKTILTLKRFLTKQLILQSSVIQETIQSHCGLLLMV